MEIDRPTLKRMVMGLISKDEHFSDVVLVNGVIEGVLLGTVDEIWWSRKSQASDVVFYTTQKGRGQGQKLARRFIAWANAQPNVEMVGMSVSSGGEQSTRAGKLLEHNGLTSVGGIYIGFTGEKENV